MAMPAMISEPALCPSVSFKPPPTLALYRTAFSNLQHPELRENS
jgi:hypothetical protein